MGEPYLVPLRTPSCNFRAPRLPQLFWSTPNSFEDVDPLWPPSDQPAPSGYHGRSDQIETWLAKPGFECIEPNADVAKQ
jgi:hypothetical protein